MRLRYRYICFSIFWLNFNFTSLIRIRNTILDSIRFVRGSEFFFRSPPTTQRASLVRRLRSTFIYLISSQCCLLFFHSSSLSVFFFCFFLPLLLVCCYFLFSISFFFSRNIVLTCCWVCWPVSGLAADVHYTRNEKRFFYDIFQRTTTKSDLGCLLTFEEKFYCVVVLLPSPISHFTMVFRLYEDDGEKKRDFFDLLVGSFVR